MGEVLGEAGLVLPLREKGGRKCARGVQRRKREGGDGEVELVLEGEDGFRAERTQDWQARWERAAAAETGDPLRAGARRQTQTREVVVPSLPELRELPDQPTVAARGRPGGGTRPTAAGGRGAGGRTGTTALRDQARVLARRGPGAGTRATAAGGRGTNGRMATTRTATTPRPTRRKRAALRGEQV